MHKIQIKTYSQAYQIKHFEFARKYWRKKVRKNHQYILWKFQLHNPENHTFLIALYNEEIIGQLGLVPVHIFHKGNIVKGFWFCDLMVDKNFRGRGVAKMLYDYGIKMNKGIFLGSDPSPAAEKSMIRYGFHLTDCGNKYLLPVDLIRTIKIKWEGFPTIFKKFPNFLMNSGLKIKNPEKNFHPTRLQDLPDHFQQARDQQASYQIKDKRFLEWRFHQRPLHQDTYYIYQSRHSSIRVLFYIAGEDLQLIELDNQDTQLTETIKLAYKIARDQRLRSVRIIRKEPFRNTLPLYMALFMIKMKTPVKILYLNKWSPREKMSFQYSPLDSDENI